ncbi:conserved hypothetical protein [Leishmania infantum JPCM5]|uniref:Uncharacterized protein n=3 Tax=Leishmania donovani species complex TaxID=38574 RepID=A4I6B4_LEIIN|nr:conserved hypothetical protein [Leishmania infantum JPCM5]XP_003863113.1 hypothetical protein, conserved [Leishmania donovani]CAC9517383.1 hypothetical_protein_-_conserved [Leishmania infantum]TPP42756.1 hypothetical protein CGC21_12205 [Leishmania donovani]CAM70338.1 conserved hypothetical protein [Leishmania infantum JPCM5]CBZ36423.1 hypothetical protein, conserved [Leishmania donovani]SUZ44224.1 hypothetical_protein_-_conserved [Leishmania infantum]|eukprot:XP_001467283.1 conserved hypothetical protein [Leishmania infantum JPCM5]
MEPSSTDGQEPHLAAVEMEGEDQAVMSNDEEDEEEQPNDATVSDTNAASTAASDVDQDGADNDDDAVDEEGDEEDDAEEDEEADDGDDSDEEEERQVYPLPPLPPVHAPSKVHGIATAEVYSIIKELRRQMDDPVEREHAKAMLQGDTDVLLAVAQVLQEAHLLRRATVNDHGVVEEQLVPQPAAARPSLPTGYNSWIVETPANARR